jgi:ribose 5-phosphate isomerase B
VKIALGGDRKAGDLELALIVIAKDLGQQVDDLGSEDPTYARVAADLAETVAAGTDGRGVVLCGTGVGLSPAAIEVPRAYCASLSDTYSPARANPSHNANTVATGAQMIGTEVAKVLLGRYLSLSFNPTRRSKDKVATIVDYESR